MKKNTGEIPSFTIQELNCQEHPHQEFDIARFEYFARDIAHLYAPHRHDFYTLLLATEGSGSHDIDFSTYAIHPLRLFFISPGQIHAWREINNLKGYVLFFTDDFFSLRYHNNVLAEFPFFNSLRHEPFMELTGQSFGNLHQLMSTLHEEYSKPKLYSDNLLRSYLNILLIVLAREYLPRQTGTDQGTQRTLIRTFENLINQHFRTKKHPRDYADLLFITPNYLNEVCKQTTGQSAGELIRKRIIIEAKRLLAHTPQTVSEIAYDLQFDDASYFCRFFKKETQKSPENFRKTFT